jgi:hypothetical protein
MAPGEPFDCCWAKQPIERWVLYRAGQADVIFEVAQFEAVLGTIIPWHQAYSFRMVMR